MTEDNLPQWLKDLEKEFYDTIIHSISYDEAAKACVQSVVEALSPTDPDKGEREIAGKAWKEAIHRAVDFTKISYDARGTPDVDIDFRKIDKAKAAYLNSLSSPAQGEGEEWESSDDPNPQSFYRPQPDAKYWFRSYNQVSEKLTKAESRITSLEQQLQAAKDTKEEK